jgi:hypothetical protein
MTISSAGVIQQHHGGNGSKREERRPELRRPLLINQREAQNGRGDHPCKRSLMGEPEADANSIAYILVRLHSYRGHSVAQ